MCIYIYIFLAENITKHLGDIQAKIQKISSHLGNLEDRKFRMKNIQREKAYEITSVGREIEQIENIKAQRLQWLRRRDEDLYKATMWLRQNKSIFKGEVFEPMAMEVSFNIKPIVKLCISNKINSNITNSYA